MKNIFKFRRINMHNIRLIVTVSNPNVCMHTCIGVVILYIRRNFVESVHIDNRRVREIHIVKQALKKCLHIIQAAEQDYEKEKLNERIAKLSGGVAVIQVPFPPQ
jgi:chaperonin GroEL (HSP60 family)